MKSPVGSVSLPDLDSEHPEFFESGGLPVYGVYYAPRVPRPEGAVVVHCHSLGVEQLTNFRNETLVARAAAAKGIPTFRFHARGHGDSAGDFAGVTLDTMVEDALAAADRAKNLSGASRVIWLGVRLGALVAGLACARRADTAALALWEPVARVPDYVRGMLRTMLMSQLAAGRKPDASVDELLARLEAQGKVDVHGYFLHRALVASAEGHDLAAVLRRHAAPTLLVQIQSRRSWSPANEAVLRQLGAAGASLRSERIAEEPGWHFVSNPAWRSPALIDLTAEWLDAVA